jgi:hypothetical protein
MAHMSIILLIKDHMIVLMGLKTLYAPKDYHHRVIQVTSIIRLNIIIRPVLKSAKDD